MRLSPDEIVLGQWAWFSLNATVVYTWAVMALLAVASWLVTRRLSDGDSLPPSQNGLEIVVAWLGDQIRAISRRDPEPFLPFVGTLFLFIAAANVLASVPGFLPPTGSLSTAVALALCVFVAVPAYAVRQQGLAGYLKQYLHPSALMLPFNVLGELSRTLALAVRLYGNVMSGTNVAAILLGVAPFFFPVMMEVLGLLTGVIQAYIFAVLAMVYISSALRAQGPEAGEPIKPSETRGEMSIAEDG